MIDMEIRDLKQKKKFQTIALQNLPKLIQVENFSKEKDSPNLQS